MSSLVLFAVMLLLALGLLRGKRERRPLNEVHSRRLVIAGGVVIPLIILFFLVGGSVWVGQSVVGGSVGGGQSMSAENGKGAQRIEVIGRLWWWEVNYLDEEGRRVMTTANEIHIPVGKSVQLLLRSPNVIHSFWVPRLQGKIDLVPGQINSLNITAKEAGVYKGRCAEFCGVQHAKMKFVVVAQPEEQFQTWLIQQKQPAEEITAPALLRGRQVFFNAACNTCHTIRGTEANGELGPDLTHIGSRLTLAAGTLPNTEGHIAGWVAGPQDIKPGNLMPLVRLEPDELQLLVGYLQSLK